jgi:hypothetical protein
MHNPVPATIARIGPDGPRRTSPALLDTDPRFAALRTRPVELAIITVIDELGRPLVGVFVPDGELL